MMSTCVGAQIDDTRIDRYLGSLVDKFFKILPMREENEQSLIEYMRGFQRELISLGELIDYIHDDGTYVSVLLCLQTLIDFVSADGGELKDIKREVFHGISLCNKLKRQCQEGGAAQ